MDEIVRVFGLDWKLLLVQAVNFGILLFVLWYFLYRRIIAMLDMRKARIEEGVRAADEATARLKAIEDERAAIIAEAVRKAQEQSAVAQARTEEQVRDMLAEATAKATRTLEDAQARAKEYQENARRTAEKEIAQIAMLTAEKVLRQKLENV